MSNRRAGQTVYCHTSGRAGFAYCGTSQATAAQQVTRKSTARHEAGTPASGVSRGQDDEGR
jgi:hypothetical protein